MLELPNNEKCMILYRIFLEDSCDLEKLPIW